MKSPTFVLATLIMTAGATVWAQSGAVPSTPVAPAAQGAAAASAPGTPEAHRGHEGHRGSRHHGHSGRGHMKSIDTDGDGMISKAEMQSMHDRRMAMFDTADANRDGKLSREEMRSFRHAEHGARAPATR